jgi:hypothetical protein
MQPYRHTYKKPFYENNANKLALSTVVLDFIPVIRGLAGIAYFSYSSTVE